MKIDIILSQKIFNRISILIYIYSFEYFRVLALSLYFTNGLTKTVEGNQEKLIDEDPIKYRKLVEAYVDETTRPLNPLSIQDGELTYVKQVSKVIPCAFALIFFNF